MATRLQDVPAAPKPQQQPLKKNLPTPELPLETHDNNSALTGRDDEAPNDTNDNVNHRDSINSDFEYSDAHDTDFDPTQSPYLSRASRKNSTASIASMGSILGSFRLSTLSIINNTDSDNASIRSSADSMYSINPVSSSTDNTSLSQQGRTGHYARQYPSRGMPTSAPPSRPKSSQPPAIHINNEHITPSTGRERDRYSGISSSSQRSPPERRVSSYPKPTGSLSSGGISSSISPGLTSSIPPSKPGTSITSSIVPRAEPSHILKTEVSNHPNNRYSDSQMRGLDPSMDFSREKPTLNRTISLSIQKHRPYSQDSPGLSPADLRTASHSASKSVSDIKVPPPASSLTTDKDSFEALRNKSLNNLLTLEEHVSLGIIYHENGNLRESSYHWQHASFQGDLTGMLLYGLALRHGWGIRQNPAEAVKWLRKAIGPTIDSNSLEDVLKSDVTKNLEEKLFKDNTQQGTPGAKKVKKAQIALALYELGMCYLNSWGIEKDEDLALRCFELAGNMGDVDALSEAASLWMHNGPKGRKKSLQRAAKLYRSAGEKGASMVSNSWIYKDKYMVGEDKKKGDKSKKK